MAMQRFNKSTLEAQLIRYYGCQKVSSLTDGMELWENPEGVGFSIPEPEEDDGLYPDFILDDLIKHGGLVYDANRKPNVTSTIAT